MIYLVKSNDKVKIGCTSNPVSRICELQVGSPYELEVLLVMDGTRKHEKALHNQFAELRRSGEWFECAPAILEFVDANIALDRRYEFGLEGAPEAAANQQLQRLRRTLRLSASQLANKLGKTQQMISAMELREPRGAVTIRSMQRVAEALGYEFQYRFIPKRGSV